MYKRQGEESVYDDMGTEALDDQMLEGTEGGPVDDGTMDELSLIHILSDGSCFFNTPYSSCLYLAQGQGRLYKGLRRL